MSDNETMVQVEKPKKKKKKVWIVLVAVAVLLIVVFASSGDSEPKVETPSGQGSDSSSVSDESQKDTDHIKVGSTVTDSEVKITYSSCDDNFTKYSKYADVASGCKIIRAAFTFENVYSSDVWLGSFECYADGEKCEEFYSPDDYSSTSLETISPGRKFSAVIYYQVPKDAKEVELEYEPDSWTGVDKYVFVVK